jgi:hypothetical protein
MKIAKVKITNFKCYGETFSLALNSGLEANATLEQLHALLNISKRLRIWLPNSLHALKHPEATPDPIV